MALPIHHQRRAEIVSGIIGGLYGGISGIWGPPLIVYLLSIGAPKAEQVRVQGVVFLIGAVMLTVAHLLTGILNPQTLPLSLLMTVPGVLELLFGFALHDRMNLTQFRRWTLALLVLTGANLIRRALTMWRGQEFVPGMIAVAVPVKATSGRLVATLSYHAPEQWMTLESRLQHVPHLFAATDELAQLIRAGFDQGSTAPFDPPRRKHGSTAPAPACNRRATAPQARSSGQDRERGPAGSRFGRARRRTRQGNPTPDRTQSS